MGRDDIKWQDLFAHFRSVQAKHEKSRRIGMSGLGPLLDSAAGTSDDQTNGGGSGISRPTPRRRTTASADLNGVPIQAAPTNRAMSPLNPRSRVPPSNGLLMSALGAGGGSVMPGGVAGRSMSPTLLAQQQQKVRRGLSLNRK